MIKKICDISNQPYDFYLDFGKMPIANAFNVPKNSQIYYNCIIGINYKLKIIKNINVPKPKKLFTNYYPYNASLSKKFSNYLNKLALEISRKYSLASKNKFIVEIGSSDGMFLQYFKDSKINHLGLEPTMNNHKIALGKGINSINKFFNFKFSKKISATYGKADVVFSSNVIAHINGINDTFKGISEILNDKGVFIFENIYLLDLIKNLSFDQLYDEHVYTISVTAINQIAIKNGLNLFSVQKTPIQGGSMRYYISKDKSKTKHKIVDKYIFKESQNPFFKKNNPNIFFNKCLKIKEDLNILINKAHKENKKIVGYGASAKATFLINFCGLNDKSFKYIFDSSLVKNNKELPGTSIKIKYEKKISEYSFDYVIVFAWNHFNEIKQKNRHIMKKNNAEWIMTFPRVRLLK